MPAIVQPMRSLPSVWPRTPNVASTSCPAGQRERVALARVFAARTPVVVADEPTSRLDAATTLEIGALLAELAHDTGTTVVCATHDPLLIGLADRSCGCVRPSRLPSPR